jgi:hypothetical protein
MVDARLQPADVIPHNEPDVRSPGAVYRLLERCKRALRRNSPRDTWPVRLNSFEDTFGQLSPGQDGYSAAKIFFLGLLTLQKGGNITNYFLNCAPPASPKSLVIAPSVRIDLQATTNDTSIHDNKATAF